MKVENWTHTLLPNLPGRQQRGLQHLVVRLAGRPVSIYNAHLDHTTPTLRQEQMRLARTIVGLDPYPAIFGGDFNASPGSPTLRVALDPAYSDLEDPWPLVGEGDGLTVPNFAPRSRIDYLLATTDWTPTVMATWESAVSTTAAWSAGSCCGRRGSADRAGQGTSSPSSWVAPWRPFTGVVHMNRPSGVVSPPIAKLLTASLRRSRRSVSGRRRRCPSGPSRRR